MDNKNKVMAVVAIGVVGLGVYITLNGDMIKGGQNTGRVMAVTTDINDSGKEVVIHKIDKATLLNLITMFDERNTKRLQAIALLEEKMDQVYNVTKEKFNKMQEESSKSGIDDLIDTRQWMFYEGSLDMRPILKVEGIKDYSTLIRGTGRVRITEAQANLFKGTEYYDFFKKYTESPGVGPYEELTRLVLSNETAIQNMGSFDKLYGSVVASKYYTYEEMLTIKKLASEYGIEVYPDITYDELEKKCNEAKVLKDKHFALYDALDKGFKGYVNNYMNKYLDTYQNMLDIYGDICYRFMGVTNDKQLEKIAQLYKSKKIFKDNRVDLVDKYGKRGEYNRAMSVKALPYSNVYTYEHLDDIKLADEFKKLVAGVPEIDIVLNTNYLEELKYVNRAEERLKRDLENQNTAITKFKEYLETNKIENEFTFLDRQLVYERCPYGTRKNTQTDNVTSGANIKAVDNDLAEKIDDESMKK